MGWTLVTGGAKRLGADLCLALAEAGHDVVIHYNKSHDAALQVMKDCQEFGVKTAAIQGDFSDMESILEFSQRYMKQFPDTENLINNVGNYLTQPILHTSIEEWMGLFQTNLNAPFVLVKALAASIIHAKGSIINIGVTGSAHAHAYASAYNITKTSLWAFTLSLAKELASQQVRVNMVSPGLISNSIDVEQMLKIVPMNRPSSCREISQVVTFLLDRKSEYITGQNIEVAGGMSL